MFPFRKWFQKTAVRKPIVNAAKRRPNSTRLAVEALEDRVTPSCTGFLTYSQGGWSGGGAPGNFLDANFATVFPNGVQIGDQTSGAAASTNSAGNWGALFTSSSAVKAYLPNGGGASTLGGDFINPINPAGSTNGPGLTLGGQALTMMLNLGFDAADPNFDGNSSNPALGSLIYNATDATSVFNGSTVSQIVGFANAYLSGVDTTSYSGGALTAALNHIIREYDNGVADGDASITLTCADECLNEETINVTSTVTILGSISGRTFEDLNGDGDDENGADPGLQWFVTLTNLGADGQYGGGDDVVVSQDMATNVDGTYTFGDLAVGSYRVVEASDPAYTATTVTFHDVTLSSTLTGTEVTTATVGCTTTITTTDNYTVDVVSGSDFGNFENISISGQKFYDLDADGSDDGAAAGEIGVQGLLVYIDTDNSGTLTVGDIQTSTDANGNYSFTNLGPGSYTVREEIDSLIGNWVQTIGTDSQESYTIVASSGTDVAGNDFGNVKLGGGGGLTLGFWSNKNGQKLVGTDDMLLLNALNLVDTDGSVAGNNLTGFTSYSQFRTWLLGANATNMSTMLSAQLAAMELNVFNGKVSGSALVYAADLLAFEKFVGDIIGTADSNIEELNSNGFITIDQLMALANEVLGIDSTTVTSDDMRAYQEALKNALDMANNNQNFVLAAP